MVNMENPLLSKFAPVMEKIKQQNAAIIQNATALRERYIAERKSIVEQVNQKKISSAQATTMMNNLRQRFMDSRKAFGKAFSENRTQMRKVSDQYKTMQTAMSRGWVTPEQMAKQDQKRVARAALASLSDTEIAMLEAIEKKENPEVKKIRDEYQNRMQMFRAQITSEQKRLAEKLAPLKKRFDELQTMKIFPFGELSAAAPVASQPANVYWTPQRLATQYKTVPGLTSQLTGWQANVKKRDADFRSTWAKKFYDDQKRLGANNPVFKAWVAKEYVPRYNAWQISMKEANAMVANIVQAITLVKASDANKAKLAQQQAQLAQQAAKIKAEAAAKVKAAVDRAAAEKKMAQARLLEAQKRAQSPAPVKVPPTTCAPKPLQEAWNRIQQTSKAVINKFADADVVDGVIEDFEGYQIGEEEEIDSMNLTNATVIHR